MDRKLIASFSLYLEGSSKSGCSKKATQNQQDPVKSQALRENGVRTLQRAKTGKTHSSTHTLWGHPEEYEKAFFYIE